MYAKIFNIDHTVICQTPCDGLKDKCPPRLMYLVTWSSFGDTLLGEAIETLRSACLMEEVCH